MRTEGSEAAFAAAKLSIPGGVNSPVRAFKQVKGVPRFMHSGKGAKVTDVDGNVYTDLCCSWGALLLGHAEKSVTAAAVKAARSGATFGCPTPLETELAALIRGAMPAVEKVRFVSSGTEAVMSAIRLARAFTGRDGIVKFDGCYHGHSDAMLVSAGSGLFQLKKASSAGVPEAVVRETYSVPYNDLSALEELLEKRKGAIACVIIEPVAANSGVIPPAPGYLKALRELTERHGALLIFDEVITGFRLGPGGAQGHFGVKPDLTCLGKIIGGGFPAAAFGGRADIMGLLAPEGPVYQAGTLSGNPVAMAAGAQTLRKALAPGFYGKLERKAAKIERVLKVMPGVRFNRAGSMFTLFFSEGEVRDAAGAGGCDKE
ncbi:MAG TPA: glutamate-1-semialdehyde 2,1-aminomutase, partial [Elusimicrobiales bacterium]|nr:glutamate-1-semialdehyde 2,1-aminomutase [Elusimicrobiales bacterium]